MPRSVAAFYPAKVLLAVFASLAFLALWPGVAGARQIAPQPPGFGHPQAPGLGKDEPEPAHGPDAQKLEHMREDDRRKHLRADTERLLQLTTELKEEVEKSRKDELSLEVVRRAAEIEKLAHDVKERMKN